MVTRVRGTQDVIDMTLRQYIAQAAQEHFNQAHFHEIKTPILEHTALFTHALGEETDVVSKEMYVFEQTEQESIKEAGKTVCLRPEGTAATIRACYENRIERFPWKVFVQGAMFRRERPQKGRLRQFHQISLEVIGSPAVEHDVMLIKLLDSFFMQKMKLSNYVLKINFLGNSVDRQQHKAALQGFLEKNSNDLCATCLTRKDANTLRIFDCKNISCQQLYQNAPKLTDHLCEESLHEWKQVQELLHMLSVSYVVDDFLVRGLDYYCKTVFEFTSRELGAQSAFCGGGRYRLGRHVGASEDYDAVGAALGIERLEILLENIKDQLPLPSKAPLTVVMPMSDQQMPLALLFANDLQQRGLTVDTIVERASMSKMMKRANKMGAQYVAVLGEEEQEHGTVMIKNMLTGERELVKQTEAADFLSKF